MASDNAVPWESGADDAEPKANTTPVRLVADTDDVLACSFSSWYPTFAKATIPSRIIPLPESFVDYLQDDGPLLLPDTSNPTNATFKNVDSDDSDSEQWAARAEDRGDQDRDLPSFPELEAKIQKAIDSLGGAVFPKLNWSAPRDVPWIMTTGTLKCHTPGDIFLLLKSSEFVTHDLTMPFDCCVDVAGDDDCGDAADQSGPRVKYELVLRRWTDIATAMEFRCFVRQNELVGISQRDHTNFYPAVANAADDIKADLVSFFNTRIRTRFPRDNYVFDIYRKGQGSMLLLDFNPLSPVTDALLFEWPELLPHVPEDVEMVTDESKSAAAATTAASAAEGAPIGGATTEQTNPAAEATAKPTLTDKLNKSLLLSFRDRLNSPSSGIPTYDSDQDEWPEDETPEEQEAREAAVKQLLATVTQQRENRPNGDGGGSAVDVHAAAGTAAGATVGGVDAASTASGQQSAADTDPTDVSFRIIASKEDARMRPATFINSRVPRDVMEISSAEDIEALARMYRRRGLGEDDQSESEEEAA
eukprot:m.180735 g.180735  ORF g.180735 m.180735 type:complete len:532 (-) comp15086_c0_seq1:102-1697(-)